jgi:hypothetical protein
MLFEEPWDDPDDNQGHSDSHDKLHENAPQWNYDEWVKRGEALGKAYVNSNWELGDWLLEGEPHLPDRDLREVPPEWRRGVILSDVYEEAEEITGLERSHLRDLASTARRVPRSVRSDALKWSHHRWLINLLPNADEATLKKWIDESVEKGYSVRQLKEAVKSTKSQGKEPIKERSFLVTVPLRIYETLHDIARGRESTLQAVTSQFLTEEFDKPELQEVRKEEKAEADERVYQRRRKVGLKVARVYNPLGLEQ